jgi:murein DD-endopeptidase MepM/ murein hydrolase activator NlpD
LRKHLQKNSISIKKQIKPPKPGGIFYANKMKSDYQTKLIIDRIKKEELNHEKQESNTFGQLDQKKDKDSLIVSNVIEQVETRELNNEVQSNTINKNTTDVYSKNNIRKSDLKKDVKKRSNFSKKITKLKNEKMKETKPKIINTKGVYKNGFIEKSIDNSKVTNASNSFLKVVTTPVISSKEVVNKYQRFDNIKDSDENSALQASEYSGNLSKKFIIKNTRLIKNDIKSKKTKLITSNKYETKKSNIVYEKQFKHFDIKSKKAEIKKYYQKIRNKAGFDKTIQNSKIENYLFVKFSDISKKVNSNFNRTLKSYGIYLILLFFILIVTTNFIASFASSMTSGISMILSTTYLASDLEITAAENQYNMLETELKYAINEVESDYPGYNEYRYFLNDIVHDPRELISYLTVKYGDFKSSVLSSEIQTIFNLQYKYELIETEEIRHKTVTRHFTDPITGEISTYTEVVEYTWNVLKVKLTAKDLNEIINELLNDDEINYYYSLMETLGNFTVLPSPINSNWINSISSMYGYRLDPFFGEIEFHNGIDIAMPPGTELLSIFDSMVLDEGFNEELGNYIIIENIDGQRALYAHCNEVYVVKGEKLNIGDVIGTVGSTGHSTGNHLHFEIKDSQGNRLNPYFYLSDEIKQN